MSPEEREIRQRLKDDFIHYAEKCLKIRSKSGEIKPFVTNRAQKYIHEKLEEQKRKTGKVRAIVLKGRQQGCCFSEKMRVLTADYRWIFIKDVQVGDRLVACDEESPGRTILNRKQSRKFRTAIVEQKKEFVKQVYEINFDNGARLEVTSDHRMLCKKRGGDEQQWRHVQDFKIGDFVRVAMRVPNYSTLNYEDGWIAGMIDGEGSARLSGAKRISITQINNPNLQRIKDYLNVREIPFKEVIDNRVAGIGSKLGNKPVHRIDIHRLPYFMELFARCRPTRFTNDEWHVGHELPGKAATDNLKPWAKVISINLLGKMKVIDLQTSTKTFICEGLVSHNSTYVGGRFYHRTTHSFGFQSFILTHALDATQNLYKMAQRYHEHCPPLVRPEISTSNSKELMFGKLESGYKIGTAENKSVGRSSTIQLFHGSEVAFWANASDHARGIMQAVPDMPGTEIILESTANGVGNYYHQMWQSAEAGLSDFIAIFVPWFWQEEYRREVPHDFEPTEEEHLLKDLYGLTNDQLAWRRVKIVDLSVNGQDGVKSFKVEYPNNPQEAFQMTGEDTYIPSELAMLARKGKAEKYGPLVIGVDPARFGDDRSSIIRRQTRCAYGLESYVKKDTMEITGIVHRIIENEKPFKVFVDVGGLGAGIVDRLHELGHRDVVVGVNAGSKPLNEKKYSNKRAEMWGECRAWLESDIVEIPDVDSLHADLCSPKYKFDSNSKLIIERKEDLKKRGIRSSDESDALCFVAGTLIQTPFGLFPIELLKLGDEVITPFGITKIAKTWVSYTDKLTTTSFSNSSVLSGKGEHKIFTWGAGVCRLDSLKLSFDVVEEYSKCKMIKWNFLSLFCTKERNSEFKLLVDIINHKIGNVSVAAFFIELFGQNIMGKFQKAMLFITKIINGGIMKYLTWKPCHPESIRDITCENIYPTPIILKNKKNLSFLPFRKLSYGISQRKELHGIKNMLKTRGKIEFPSLKNASFVTRHSKLILKLKKLSGFAQDLVIKKIIIKSIKLVKELVNGVKKSLFAINIKKPNVVAISVQTENVQQVAVYNLTLEKHNVYYANNILVFNCLTFAYPASALTDNTSKSKEVAGKLMNNYRRSKHLRQGRYGSSGS